MSDSKKGPKNAASAPATPVSFEANLDALGQIVKKLESGDLPLEDALKQFEEGVKLTRECSQYLGAAEQQVEQLTKVNTQTGAVETQPFK